MKTILAIAIALSVSTLAQAETKKMDACIKGYKGAIDKYALETDASKATEYCNAINNNPKAYSLEDLIRRWNGLDYSLLIEQSYRKGETNGLNMVCKAGAYTAMAGQDQILKNKNVSPNIAAHEVCIGPVKEGSVIEKTKVNSEGKLVKSYAQKRLGNEMVNHGEHISYFDNGKVQSVYEYKDGEKDGKVQFFKANGKMIEETHYEKGDRHGKYVKYDHSTFKVIEEGQYKNDKKDGTWMFYDKDGKKEKKIVFDMGDAKEKTSY
jgi:hypothetical protein